MRPVTKQQVTQYNADDYDVMRRYLFENLGAYCSYCEQPISNDSAVEHKVPKSVSRGFPAYQVQWRNLLLGCQSCNSAKSVTPDKNNVANHNNLSTERWYMATLGLWVWPDSTPAKPGQPAPPVDESYQLFTPLRQQYTQVQLVAAGLVRAPWVNVPPAWATAPATMVWITPNDTYINAQPNAAALRQRVLNTIQGLNLNLYNADDQRYNNRRVVNREAAYATATASLQRLRTVYAAVPNVGSQRMRLMVKAIRNSVLASGFWSVWFWVFRSALDNPANGTSWHGVSLANRRELLLRTLVYYYAAERNGLATVPILPGTDAARLDLAAFS